MVKICAQWGGMVGGGLICIAAPVRPGMGGGAFTPVALLGSASDDAALLREYVSKEMDLTLGSR